MGQICTDGLHDSAQKRLAAHKTKVACIECPWETKWPWVFNAFHLCQRLHLSTAMRLFFACEGSFDLSDEFWTAMRSKF